MTGFPVLLNCSFTVDWPDTAAEKNTAVIRIRLEGTSLEVREVKSEGAELHSTFQNVPNGIQSPAFAMTRLDRDGQSYTISRYSKV